jgi:uncharacterized protein YggE
MDNDFMHDLFGNGTVRVALVGVLAILALFLLAETVGVAQDFGRPSNPASDTVTVSADGQATMAPDVARVTFTVQNAANAVSDAQAATTKQANAALDYVKGQGIADKDVRTVSYEITPQYAYYNCPVGELCPQNSKITGYQVSETIEVTVRDLTSVGTLVSGLGSLQVQNISGPAFGLEDSTAGYDAARADAIAKAKNQADLLAKQLGVRLGKIVNFSESSGGYPYPVMAYGMGGAADSAKSVAPNVPTGQNTYNASVTLTYEIR